MNNPQKNRKNNCPSETEWFDSTKEKLSSDDVLKGLLDHGLFAEKLPACFTSDGLSKVALSSTNNKERTSFDFIRYEALRDSNIPRPLGIPHPQAYAAQALAIATHWEDIAKHCNTPKPTFSRIHVRQLRNGRIFEMNYKGSERFRQEEDEQAWMSNAQYMVEADIATCFPSIYTHSIPWALHGKTTAKEERSPAKLYGNLLDKCTQNTRDGQTNGLLIGPHSSNIISEIILTKIDTELQDKGYTRVKRHVDDYRFYAATFEEAEKFIKDLGLALRTYEMSLNEKKTKITCLPSPSEANWILSLNRHPLPKDKELKFTEIRSFLDHALTCAQNIGKSTPLNYAIKVLAKSPVESNSGYIEESAPRKLSARAKLMYTQEAMNLALAYPYLVPLLDKYVFTPYWHDELKDKIATFATSLISRETQKLHPDPIAHVIFLALKYRISLNVDLSQLKEIIKLNDCVVNVLLLEYAKLQNQEKLENIVKDHANQLKNNDKREIDKHWLLIYQVWTENELRENGQGFLADLKRENFTFYSKPNPSDTPTLHPMFPFCDHIQKTNPIYSDVSV